MFLTSFPRPSPLLLGLSVVILTAAYLWALFSRPVVPDWKREQDRGYSSVDKANAVAHAYGFPSWYAGGPSPYDHPPLPKQQDREPLDILLFIGASVAELTPLTLPRPPTSVVISPLHSDPGADNSSSIPAALYTYRLLEQATGVNVQPIAPFSPLWNGSLGVAENLKAAGCRQILWRIGDGEAAFALSNHIPDDSELGLACPDSTAIK